MKKILHDCPECHQRIESNLGLAGFTTTCPQCGKSNIVVPEKSERIDPPSPASELTPSTGTCMFCQKEGTGTHRYFSIARTSIQLPRARGAAAKLLRGWLIGWFQEVERADHAGFCCHRCAATVQGLASEQATLRFFGSVSLAILAIVGVYYWFGSGNPTATWGSPIIALVVDVAVVLLLCLIALLVPSVFAVVWKRWRVRWFLSQQAKDKITEIFRSDAWDDLNFAEDRYSD